MERSLGKDFVHLYFALEGNLVDWNSESLVLLNIRNCNQDLFSDRLVRERFMSLIF